MRLVAQEQDLLGVRQWRLRHRRQAGDEQFDRDRLRLGIRERSTYPDGIVVLQGDAGSAVLCLEVDEATEPGPVIADKLERYEKAFWSRVWYLLFVTGSPERAARIAAIGRSEPRPGLAGKAWALVFPDLVARGLGTPIIGLSVTSGRSTLGALLTDPRSRRCPTPVGSDAWLRLLGTGGLEYHDEALG